MVGHPCLSAGDNPMKPRRDTRARNLVFWITVISALVVGLWLAR